MKNILLVSLGCDKNLCDSEEMLGLLIERGYNITNDENEADVAIVNTCSFISDALNESIETVLELAKLKENRLKYLVVTGCMSERYKDGIEENLPEADAFIGTTAILKIVDVIDGLYERDSEDKNFENDKLIKKGIEEVSCPNGRTAFKAYNDKDFLPEATATRFVTTGPFTAYLKIAEGCNKRCTYCAIPSFRGNFRSVPKEQLLAQVENMAKEGIKEIILVAQETTCYGIDIYGEKRLHTLMKEISLVDGIEWIRLLYCYPEEIYDELILEMATNPKILHYIDMPLQHTEDDILRRMGRRINKEGLYKIVGRLREKMPDIALRTTLITGFPGETDEMHEELLRTINELEFDRLGVFCYSPEEGTPAAGFPDQIAEEVKEKYRDEVMELQQAISFDINERFVGKTMRVVVEGYMADDDVYAARSYRDAPNVDGFVFVKCDYELMSGTFVTVKITEASEYDLIGEIVDEFTE